MSMTCDSELLCDSCERKRYCGFICEGKECILYREGKKEFDRLFTEEQNNQFTFEKGKQNANTIQEEEAI